jgi:hypothetical protein
MHAVVTFLFQIESLSMALGLLMCFIVLSFHFAVFKAFCGVLLFRFFQIVAK